MRGTAPEEAAKPPKCTIMVGKRWMPLIHQGPLETSLTGSAEFGYFGKASIIHDAEIKQLLEFVLDMLESSLSLSLSLPLSAHGVLKQN